MKTIEELCFEEVIDSKILTFNSPFIFAEIIGERYAKSSCIDFIRWINHNHYEPTLQGYWRLKLEDSRYSFDDVDGDAVNLITADKLYEKYLDAR